MKSFQKDSWPVNLGIKRGIPMLPSINSTIATPAVITTKTTANPTDNADVYLSESDTVEVRGGQINNYFTNLNCLLGYIMCTTRKGKKVGSKSVLEQNIYFSRIREESIQKQNKFAQGKIGA